MVMEQENQQNSVQVRSRDPVIWKSCALASAETTLCWPLLDLLSSFSFLAFSSCSLRICRTTLSSSLSASFLGDLGGLSSLGDRGGLGDLGRSSLRRSRSRLSLPALPRSPSRLSFRSLSLSRRSSSLSRSRSLSFFFFFSFLSCGNSVHDQDR